MDVDQVLEELRSAVSDYEDTRGHGGSSEADRMRDAFRALDDWLSVGGFSPAAWRRTT